MEMLVLYEREISVRKTHVFIEEHRLLLLVAAQDLRRPLSSFLMTASV